MKEQLTRFLIPLLLFSLVLYFSHYFLLKFFLPEIVFYYSLLSIYLFHVLATFATYFFLVFINNNFKDYTGYAFMGASLFKMMAAIVFLLPMLLNRTDETFLNLISFFIPYFLFLFIETFFAIRLINNKQ